MSMSYCRFRNALKALQDCQNNLFDTDLSTEEDEARDKLIELIHEIGYDTGIEENIAEKIKIIKGFWVGGLITQWSK